MPTIPLRLTTIIGRRCEAVWQRPDQTILRVPLDPVDYDVLVTTTPAPPEVGAVFVGATEHPLFDTPSGRLEAGCLVEKPEGWMVVKTGTGSPKQDRILISTTRDNPRGSGTTFAADVPGLTIRNGEVTF